MLYQANGSRFVPYIGTCRVMRLIWPWSYLSPWPQYDSTFSPAGLLHSGTQGRFAVERTNSGANLHPCLQKVGDEAGREIAGATRDENSICF